MKSYWAVLRIADYRTLWIGALVSLIGDGASWIAMSWLAVTSGGAGTLTILGICYSGPIVIGGLLAGKLVDRFSRRLLLVTDCAIRGAALLVLPVLAVSGQLAMWHLYSVAAVYGLLKILPIGIIPTVIPELVPKKHLHTAIALESIATNAAGLLGPVIGGVLVPLVGVNWVLTVDALSYFAFALAVLTMKARLPKPVHSESDSAASRGSWAPVVRFLRADRVMLIITVAFTTFNVAMGVVLVVQPWLAHERLPGGATMLGVLVGVLAGAEMIGAIIAGVIKPAVRPMLRIGLLQLMAGAGLLLFLGANPVLVLLGQLICGVPAALLTVSSQAVRYARTPEELRGRTMTLMRTLMLSALPLGSIIAGPLLAAGYYTATVIAMAVLAGVPGLLAVVYSRDDVINSRAPEPEPEPEPSGSSASPSSGALEAP